MVCFTPYVCAFNLKLRFSVGGGVGVPKGLAHNLLMLLLTLGSSKMEVFQTYDFDIVITYNDHPRYVKHVLGHIYAFFTLFGYWVWVWGVSLGIATQLAYAVFHLLRLKVKVFAAYFFDIVIT